MECLKYHRMISEYIDGSLGQSSEESLLAHLSECESCSNFYKNELKLKSFIKDSYSMSAKKVDLTRNIMSMITEKQQPVKSKKSLNLRRFVYVASFFVLAGASYMFSNIFENKSQVSSVQKSDKLEELVLEHMDRSNVIAVSGISIANVVYEK